MHRHILLTTLFTILLSSNILFAQATSDLTPKGIAASDESSLAEISHNENWSFYVDNDSQTYYIDFEKINVNLSNIVVKNQKGEVILKEDVYDLPVNTIYEVDFSVYGKGKYEIQLRSFTGMIRKTVSIQ